MEEETKLTPSTGTIVRTILTFVAIINMILAYFGKSPIPFDDAEITSFIYLVVDICVRLWTWWKNNSFTTAAIMGDITMHRQKAKKKLYKNAK